MGHGLRRDGQISIDYLAGALIFFGALVLLVSNVMTTLPQFASSQDRDELELSAWSISEVLVSHEGWWDGTTGNGTDWHDHVADVQILGLAAGDGELSSAKIDALTRMEPDRIRDVLDTEKGLSLTFRHIAPVDTHRTFQQGSPPSHLTPPSSYDPDAVSTVHYGAARITDENVRVMLTQEDHVGWYNVLRVSRDADFTNVNTETYNLTSTAFITLGASTFTAETGHTQVSDGKQLVLARELGQAGTSPPASAEDIVSVERFGVMNDDEIVEVSLQAWQ